jgi:hypothetical protein
MVSNRLLGSQHGVALLSDLHKTKATELSHNAKGFLKEEVAQSCRNLRENVYS